MSESRLGRKPSLVKSMLRATEFTGRGARILHDIPEPVCQAPATRTVAEGTRSLSVDARLAGECSAVGAAESDSLRATLV